MYLQLWDIIGDYLSVKDLKNLGETCKTFRQGTLRPLSRKVQIKFSINCGKSFTSQMTKFCRRVQPIIVPNNSKLNISFNTYRYGSTTLPQPNVLKQIKGIADKGVYLREKNQFFTVKNVFENFCAVKFGAGIGAKWHVSCFIHMWNLIAASSRIRIFLFDLFILNNMASQLQGKDFARMKKFEAAKKVGITCYRNRPDVSLNFDQMKLLLSKFPNAREIYTFPLDVSELVYDVLLKSEVKHAWKLIRGYGGDCKICY